MEENGAARLKTPGETLEDRNTSYMIMTGSGEMDEQLEVRGEKK